MSFWRSVGKPLAWYIRAVRGDALWDATLAVPGLLSTVPVALLVLIRGLPTNVWWVIGWVVGTVLVTGIPALSIWRKRRKVTEVLSRMGFALQGGYGTAYLIPGNDIELELRVRVLQLTGTLDYPWTVPWTDSSIGTARVSPTHPQKLKFCRYFPSEEVADGRRGGEFTFLADSREITVVLPTDDMREACIPWELHARLEVTALPSREFVHRDYVFFIGEGGEFQYRVEP